MGSLIVEPLARKTGFVMFAPYSDFVRACKVDSKIELLSEQNNMFRTLAALFIAIPGLRLFDAAVSWLQVSRGVALSALCVGMFALFAAAYRKQTGYVAKRAEANANADREIVVGR